MMPIFNFYSYIIIFKLFSININPSYLCFFSKWCIIYSFIWVIIIIIKNIIFNIYHL